MPEMSVYVDADTIKRLLVISRETMREASELAECAISEEALSFFRGRDDDPIIGKPVDAQTYASHEEHNATP